MKKWDEFGQDRSHSAPEAWADGVAGAGWAFGVDAYRSTIANEFREEPALRFQLPAEAFAVLLVVDIPGPRSQAPLKAASSCRR